MKWRSSQHGIEIISLGLFSVIRYKIDNGKMEYEFAIYNNGDPYELPILYKGNSFKTGINKLNKFLADGNKFLKECKSNVH